MLRASKYGLISLPREAVDVERIKRELTILNGSYANAVKFGQDVSKLEKFFKCYVEWSDRIAVPRHYAIPWKGKPLPLRVSRNYPVVERGLNTEFVPRPEQPEAIAALASSFSDKIIACRCGFGKTVVTIAAWAKHRTGPLLILVDTQELAKQWKLALLQVCHMMPHEIGSLKADVCDWEGRSVVIGFVQTMWRRNYPQELYKYFQVVAYDEVHICGANKLQLTLPKFHGERWGLSATPERADGNSRIIRLHMGEIEYQNLEQPTKPKVFFVQTTYKAPHWIPRSMRFFAMAQSALSKNSSRNADILGYVNRAGSTKRAVLVLGTSIKQLMFLKESNDYGSESGLLVGATPLPKKRGEKQKHRTLKEAEREEALTNRLVFATGKLASKGLDKSELDTLILPFPVGDDNTIQQMFGRIQRGRSAIPPVVVVFEDPIKNFINACNKIRAYCDVHGIEYSYLGKQHELEEVAKPVNKFRHRSFFGMKKNGGYK